MIQAGRKSHLFASGADLGEHNFGIRAGPEAVTKGIVVHVPCRMLVVAWYVFIAVGRVGRSLLLEDRENSGRAHPVD